MTVALGDVARSLSVAITLTDALAPWASAPRVQWTCRIVSSGVAARSRLSHS